MTGKKSATKQDRLPLPVVLLVVSFATPPELSLDLGGLRLSPYRLVVIAMLIPCLSKLIRRQVGTWTFTDSAMLLHSLWVILALVAYAGLGQGIESGGIYFFEAFGGFLVSRCLIRNSQQFLALARLMLGVVFVMMFVAGLESVTGNHFIRVVSRTLLGGPPLPVIEPRLGLHRAFTSFDHPILFGIFCASTLGMAAYLPSKKSAGASAFRPLVSVVATFFSLSSGAFSALGVQLAIVGYDRATKGIQYRWHFLVGTILSVWSVITLASNRGPVKVFLTYFTFSPGTGYNRLRIWEYGSAEVIRHPILGIGLGEWQRPAWMVSGSMDNFWLATAVRYGMPAFILLALAIAFMVLRLLTARNTSREFARCRSAWLVSIAGLSLAACTVHFWNALFCLFCFLLGAGAWMLTASSSRK